jgi:myo-inositol 2-dehydrogenase/D-chiro-inositol 1-dehydrogenase
MGSTHARALAGHRGIEIAGVVEPSDGAVAWLEARTPRYREVDEFLARERCDGALVAVPTRAHLPVVTRLLAAGLPVLCEKPLGLTSTDAERLAHFAWGSGVPLRVGYWRRFVPEIRQLRHRIASGEFGEIQVILCGQWDAHPPAAAFRDPASSGGILVDMGVHEWDQIRWLTGQDIVEAGGFASSVCSDPPVSGDPESVAVVARLSGGGTAIVTLVRRHPPGEIVWLEVVGTRSAVRLELIAPPDGDERLHLALRAQIEDFAGVAGGAPGHGATPADAVAALATAERVAAALRGG